MKTLLMIMGMVVMAGTASMAQDSSRLENIRKEGERAREQKPAQDMKGWTKLKSNEVPSQLRNTLSGNEYRGWQDAAIYKHDITGRYMVQYKSTKDTPSPTIYYFDKEGKRIEDPGTR